MTVVGSSKLISSSSPLRCTPPRAALVSGNLIPASEDRARHPAPEGLTHSGEVERASPPRTHDAASGWSVRALRSIAAFPIPKVGYQDWSGR